MVQKQNEQLFNEELIPKENKIPEIIHNTKTNIS